MIVWSLIRIVTIKYVALVMGADNRGEGGILALLALVPSPSDPAAEQIGLLVGAVV